MIKSTSAGGIILNSKNQIVLVYHGKGNWNFPKGHVEKGETLEETAKREIAEETGITDLELVKPIGQYSRFRIGADGVTEIKDELKTMHFFLFKSDQAKLKPTDPIHSEAKWVDINKVSTYLKHPKDNEFIEKVKKRFGERMKNVISSKFSLSSVQIEQYFNNTKLAIGTAFFYKHNNEVYLITNWHNITGRNNIDKKIILHSKGAIPNKLRIHMPYYCTKDNVKYIKYVTKIVEVYLDDENTKPRWYEDKEGQIDIAVMLFTSLEETAICCVNDDKLLLNNFDLYPGLDVFIIGYPEGLCSGGKIPIWKRGSIASEPNIDIDNESKIYIDTATRKGMSGSPVFAQERGTWTDSGYQKLDKDHTYFGIGHKFIGIYSGRIGDDTFLAQLGVVWKEKSIKKIIEEKYISKSSFHYYDH